MGSLMGWTIGFVAKDTRYDGDVASVLDDWAQFSREGYADTFAIAIDDDVYWFGNMAAVPAKQALALVQGAPVIKDDTRDNDTVRILRIGSWGAWEKQIEAEAALEGVNLQAPFEVDDDALESLVHGEGSTVFADCTSVYRELAPNTAARLQYGHVASHGLLADSADEVGADRGEAGAELAKCLQFVASVIQTRKLLYAIEYDSVGYGDADVPPAIPWPRFKLG